MTRSKDMRQLAKEKLRSAQNAHDILDALWEGAWAKREKSDDEQHPPPPSCSFSHPTVHLSNKNRLRKALSSQFLGTLQTTQILAIKRFPDLANAFVLPVSSL